jgi:WD40 repeat protein
MSSIFISYSRKDKLFAERLSAALAERSRDVWIDWEDIPPTAQWRAEISAAIEAADAFLFLISPDAVASRACSSEIAEAVTLHKRLLPLLVRETPPEDVAKELADINWLYFRESDDFEQTLSRLLEALNTDLDWVRDHSRLLVRAAEWERHASDESYLLRGADLDAAQAWLAGAAAGKRPEPAPLHYEYIRACQQAQAREVERLQGLYKNALARQLAAQCALLQREADALLDRSILLAVESMRRVPNAEADRCLREGLRLRAQELSRWRHEGPESLLVVSPRGDFVATCGAADEVIARRCSDFEPCAVAHFDKKIVSLSFVPKNGPLCVATADGALSLMDLESGHCTTLGQYSGRVRAVHALSDGSALLSVGEGLAVCHELGDGHERWRLALEGNAFVAASNGDSSLVAVGAEDCVVRLIDARDGTLRHEFQHERKRPLFLLERGSNDFGIVALAFMDEASCLCSAGLDGNLRVWDLASGELRHSFAHARDLLCMAAHNGLGLVACGGLDRSLRVWDVVSGREMVRLAHQGAVTALSWSEDGRWLLSGCGDGTARLWAVSENVTVTEAARCVHGDWVETAVLPANGSPLSVTEHAEVVAWDRGEPDWRGLNHSYAIKGAVCSDDGRQVLAFLDGHNQILYDTGDNFSWRILEHPDFVDDAWFTRDDAVITTCWDGAVREFDLATLAVRCSQEHAGRVWNAVLSPDQNFIATAVHREHCARLWRRGELTPEAELPHTEQVRSLAFAPDGRLLATACDDGSVRVWDLASAQVLWSGEHQGIAWWVGFDAEGGRVASCGEEGHVVLREARSGAVQQTLTHEAPVSAFAFSPDGQRLAVRLSFNGPPEVPVWHLGRGEMIARLLHEEHVHDMDWSADSTLLATASQDHRVRVFEVDARRERMRLQYGGICVTARFVPATQQLLSTSYDGSLRLSIVAPGELIESALARVPRRLSDAEWRQYLPDERRES